MGGARCGLALWGLRSQSTAQEGARSAHHTRRRRRRVPPGERAVTAPSRSVPGGARCPGTGRLAARATRSLIRQQERSAGRTRHDARCRCGPGSPWPARHFCPLSGARGKPLPAASCRPAPCDVPLPFSARPWSLQNFESFVMVSPQHFK